MSDTPAPTPDTRKPVTAVKTVAPSFDVVVESVAKELGIENPRGNHEVNLGVVHSLIQRTQGDLADADVHANEQNAQKYLDALCEKSTGLLFAAKLQAKLVSNFCGIHNLATPDLIAKVDAIRS